MLSSIIESISAASIRIPQCNGLDRYLVTNAPSFANDKQRGKEVRARRHGGEATFVAPGALVSKAAEGNWVPRRAAVRDEGLSPGA